MTRAASVVVALLLVGPVWASNPGEPLDCSDLVFGVPGLTCSLVIDVEPNKGSNLAIDNQGRQLTVLGGEASGTVIRARSPNDGTNVIIGTISPREGVNGTFDRIRTSSCGGCLIGDTLWFDPIQGVLYVPGYSYCWSPSGGQGGNGCPYNQTEAHLRIGGFGRLFEIFETYTPTSETISFRVPGLPEGFQAADWFDTYYGDIATVGDWSQAQPLQCGYPATAPQVGDYLTVVDTTPDPQPGQGYYYITAANYQGQRRYGRKATNGVLTGRDPAVLPGCN